MRCASVGSGPKDVGPPFADRAKANAMKKPWLFFMTLLAAGCVSLKANGPSSSTIVDAGDAASPGGVDGGGGGGGTAGGGGARDGSDDADASASSDGPVE